jgi:integrase
VKLKVEKLVVASITGAAVEDETARWVAQLADTLYEKLAAVGPVPKSEAVTLQAFLDGYIASRADVKPSTATVYGHTRRNLIEHFGPNKPLRDITPGDADAWRLGLVRQKLGDNTVRRRCGIVKQFFRAAVRQKLIASNSFADLVSAVHWNPKREHFVTRADADKVLEACPDAEWRLLFALSRFGGLRCPSEHLRLRWSDVDWQRSRITVHSPKTQHHPGGDCRVIPLFPELLPYLREAFELADDGAEYVISRYRATSANLRTQLTRIIKRAGLTPWPKLFHNLRASRETELVEGFPAHVVCSWIGNSQLVAAKHYLQVTDEHYERGVSGNGALQNPVQNPSATERTAGNDPSTEPAPQAVNAGVRDDAPLFRASEMGEVGGTGLEPVTSSL